MPPFSFRRIYTLDRPLGGFFNLRQPYSNFRIVRASIGKDKRGKYASLPLLKIKNEEHDALQASALCHEGVTWCRSWAFFSLEPCLYN